MMENAATYRVRIAHTHTLKDGWRLSETTVEATGSTIDYAEIHDHMEAAHSMGVGETKRRNSMERDYNHGVFAAGVQSQ